MANQRINSGTSVPIEVAPLLDRATVALATGVTVRMKVRRKSDAFAFDWDDLTFKLLASVTTLESPAFTEIDATDFPGEYALLFDLAAYSGINAQDVYEFTIIESGSTNVSNLPQSGEVSVDSLKTDEVHRRLGLLLGTPAVHTPTSIVAGASLSQTVDTVGDTVTVTRDP